MRIKDPCSNPGLILHKGLGFTYDPRIAAAKNKDNLETAKRDLWNRLIVATATAPNGYQDYLTDMIHVLGEGVVYAFNQRVVVGLGIEVPTERGISLHHTFGTPVFPGSGIKGILVREALHQLQLEHLIPVLDTSTPRFFTLPFAWAAVPGATDEQKKALLQMQALFGDIEGVGRLKVYDALWNPSKRFLRPNVDTQHNVEYYQGKRGRWPDDTDGPNPIHSVTLKKGVRMRFWLNADDDTWTKAAYVLLDSALARIGIGAKTSAGYGRRERTP